MLGISEIPRPLLYVGTDHPSMVEHLSRAMVSFNVLEHRRSDFTAHKWIMDSGAFTRITNGRDHLPVEDYAQCATRWAECGTLEAVVGQDYMCEPFMLKLTGLTVHDHQRMTTERWLSLRRLVPTLYVMPVLQGYTPAEYVDHLGALAPHLPSGSWVGVGSVCKRNANPDAISTILTSLLQVRPDLRLHGFGVKVTALKRADIMARFWSVDSMAWSFAARIEGRDQHSGAEMLEWEARTNSINPHASQMAMPLLQQ